MSLIALEPRAMPSARACMHRPIVVLERPVGAKGDEPEDTCSNVGDDGIEDSGIGD